MRKLLIIPVIAVVAALAPVHAQAQTNPADTWSPGFYDTQNVPNVSAIAAWARVNGIATGSNRVPVGRPALGPVPHFLPNDLTTRGHALAMLWRAAGQPPECSDICSDEVVAPPDVNPKTEVGRAAAWAARNGVISKRVNFHPNRPVTRAQIVTMLWRANGATTGCPADVCVPDAIVDDIPANAYYADAVTWAMRSGVIVQSLRFNPNGNVTRGTAITILHRQYGPEFPLTKNGVFSSTRVTGRSLVPGSILSMTITPSSQSHYDISVSAGCNTGRTTARAITDNRVFFERIASTKKLCRDLDAQERWFFDWLRSGPTVTRTASGFILTSKGVSVEFAPGVNQVLPI